MDTHSIQDLNDLVRLTSQACRDPLSEEACETYSKIVSEAAGPGWSYRALQNLSRYGFPTPPEVISEAGRIRSESMQQRRDRYVLFEYDSTNGHTYTATRKLNPGEDPREVLMPGQRFLKLEEFIALHPRQNKKSFMVEDSGPKIHWSQCLQGREFFKLFMALAGKTPEQILKRIGEDLKRKEQDWEPYAEE